MLRDVQDSIYTCSSSSTSSDGEYRDVGYGTASSSSRDPQKRKRGNDADISESKQQYCKKNRRRDVDAGVEKENERKMAGLPILNKERIQDEMVMDIDNDFRQPASEHESTSIWMNVQGDIETKTSNDDIKVHPFYNSNSFKLSVDTPTGHPHPYMSDSFLSRMHLGAGYFDLISS